MSRKKQIEPVKEIKEIADIIHREDGPLVVLFYNDSLTLAEKLYNAGYRKASDVAREICAEIGERFKSLLEMLPADGALTDAKTFIEAHWEFIEHSIVYAYDAELKKKYESEGEG